MLIELSPIKVGYSNDTMYSARLLKQSELVAEITAVPLEVATGWAEAMRAVHDNLPQIRRVGICMYCGGTEQAGAYCGDCQRVFRSA